MNFKEYIVTNRKKKHEEILTDICVEIHNCTDCYNEDSKCCICNAVSEMTELLDISTKGFYMQPYDSKTNLRLCEIAGKHGYRFEIVLRHKGILLHFFKNKNEK